MKKVIKRLLIFFVGIPAIVAIVLLFPHHNHLVLNLLVVTFSALGAVELSVMLAHKQLHISKAEAAIMGALPPLMMILNISFGFNPLLLPAVTAASVSWLLVSSIFFRGSTLDNFLNRFAAGCAVLLYPGMLLTWLVRMSHWEASGIIILVFLCTVFAGDSLAWATGKLLGKGNQGFIPVSPNKSIAGFIGGLIASTMVGAGTAVFWPEIFATQQSAILGIPVVAGSVLGLLTGTAAILGDLGESAIKRSSGSKDSGHIIPGRGGVLDSIDSISLAAPVFYIVFSLLFAQP
ncbi:MAG: phosphatidate cytidylyltransferase [Treponema sp.]|nr:phosphatidate cytidylyltransferase [Treponema sp.]